MGDGAIAGSLGFLLRRMTATKDAMIAAPIPAQTTLIGKVPGTWFVAGFETGALLTLTTVWVERVVEPLVAFTVTV